MTSIFSKFTRKSRSPRLPIDDQEKAAAYEGDRTRLMKTPAMVFGRRRRGSSSPQQRYMGSFAPNPAFIKLLRFLLYGLTSLSSLVTAALGCAVVAYYNSHGPVIKPSWGSLIAVIVFGFGTPGVLFGTFFFTPLLFRPGSVLGIINQTKVELFMLFNVTVVWISGALALAVDLRGRDYCLWDGYFHYPKPTNFEHVCNLINYMVALAYTTFGLAALQMSVVFLAATYILLYLDQEALTEPTNDLGGRAYRARMAALSQHRANVNAERNEVSTAGPFSPTVGAPSTAGPMSGGVPASRQLPGSHHESEGGPMMTGGSRSASRSQHSRTSSNPNPFADGDEERAPSRAAEREEPYETNALSGDGYYGYENPNRMGQTRV